MLICKVCQCEFKYDGPRGPHYQAMTCGRRCRSKLTGIRNSNNRKNPIVITSCPICGKEVVNAITCSRECNGKRLADLYAGRQLTESWKLNQSRSKRRENIIRYGEFICEKCDKHFDNNLSLRAHRSYCTPRKDAQKFPCEICQKVFTSSRGLKIHAYCHNEEWNEPRKLKMTNKAQNRKNQSTSKAEIGFYKKLVEFFGLSNIIHKFKIEGCSHEYDFFIPAKNLIIEFDGDYWHGNKKFHTFTPRMKKQYCIDQAWNEKAINAGYNIKRIWESDSNNILLENL